MRNYLLVFGGTVMALLAAVLTANIGIDPYDISGVSLPAGANAIKSTFGDNHVLGKPFVAWRRKPIAVVFGTSRENHAIDTDHPAWPSTAGSRYNLAMDAASIVDIERLFEHVSAVSDVKEAVIALDFLNMFDANMHGADNFDASLLVSDSHSRTLAALNSLRYFSSWPMLRDSVRTIRNQDPELTEFEPTGRRNSLVFNRAAKRFGQHHMFAFSELRYFRARINLPIAQRFDLIDKRGRSTLLHLANILDRAAGRNIRVHLFITPVHARQLEVYRLLGLWNALEDWKRKVGRIAEGKFLRTTSTPFALWDFADYTELTSEPVPRPGDFTTRMQWYWESSHYTKALGNAVLERIFGASSPAVPQDFGVQIRNVEMETYLQRVRANGDRYRTTHPEDMRDLAAESAEVIASGIVLPM